MAVSSSIKYNTWCNHIYNIHLKNKNQKQEKNREEYEEI